MWIKSEGCIPLRFIWSNWEVWNKENSWTKICSQAGIFSIEGQSKGNRCGKEVSAAQRRQDFMRTTGFPSAGIEQPTL